MPSQTNEQALEAAIEKHLTGSCMEDRKTDGVAAEAPALYRSGKGYYAGAAQDFNANNPVLQCANE